MIPPCSRCRHYSPGKTATLCLVEGEPQPIFYASLKRGPEFKCFEEKNATLPQERRSNI